MNKPYFAKWLPVEGDIRSGRDVPVFRDGKLTFMQLETSEKMLAFTELPGYKNNTYKPAKMFLCSRDIKLGDRYYHDSFHPYPTGDIADTNTKVMNAHMMVSNEGADYEGDWSYKVIGEISPDALPYVKKGQEFAEDDVHQLPFGRKTKWKIKCNMGHFH